MISHNLETSTSYHNELIESVNSPNSLHQANN